MTLATENPCTDRHWTAKLCDSDGRWLVGAHGKSWRVCEHAAKRIRKEMMAGTACYKCAKPKAMHWELIEVSS